MSHVARSEGLTAAARDNLVGLVRLGRKVAVIPSEMLSKVIGTLELADELGLTIGEVRDVFEAVALEE